MHPKFGYQAQIVCATFGQNWGEPAMHVQEDDPATYSSATTREGAIRGLALGSLTAVKVAQDARWPCIVRPVSLPRITRNAPADQAQA